MKILRTNKSLKKIMGFIFILSKTTFNLITLKRKSILLSFTQVKVYQQYPHCVTYRSNIDNFLCKLKTVTLF